MIALDVRYGSDRIAEAMRRAPTVMERHAVEGLDKAAAEVARLAKFEAPKATTTLTNSIQIRRPGDFTRVVTPGTGYADFVNEGTGIYGPRHQASGRMPNVQSLEDWIRVKRIQPRDKNMSERALAFVIAAGIAKTGTPKNAFMERAAEKGTKIAQQRMAEAMEQGLHEVMQA